MKFQFPEWYWWLQVFGIVFGLLYLYRSIGPFSIVMFIPLTIVLLLQGRTGNEL